MRGALRRHGFAIDARNSLRSARRPAASECSGRAGAPKHAASCQPIGCILHP